MIKKIKDQDLQINTEFSQFLLPFHQQQQQLLNNLIYENLSQSGQIDKKWFTEKHQKQIHFENQPQQPQISIESRLSPYISQYNLFFENCSIPKQRNPFIQKMQNRCASAKFIKYPYTPYLLRTKKTHSRNAKKVNIFTVFYQNDYTIQVLSLPEKNDFNFQFSKLRSKGASGNVFEVSYQNQLYVVKEINYKKLKDGLHDIIREYAMMKYFDDLQIGPKIPCLYGFDVIVTDDCAYFSMERGISLFQYQEKLNDQSKFNAKIEELKESLKLLHKVRITHNDIKPQNIIYSPSRNKLVFIDFGLTEINQVPFGQMNLQTPKGTVKYCCQDMRNLFLSENKSGYVDLYFNDMECLRKTIEQTKLNLVHASGSQNNKILQDFETNSEKKNEQQAESKQQKTIPKYKPYEDTFIIIRLIKFIQIQDVNSIEQFLCNQRNFNYGRIHFQKVLLFFLQQYFFDENGFRIENIFRECQQKLFPKHPQCIKFIREVLQPYVRDFFTSIEEQKKLISQKDSKVDSNKRQKYFKKMMQHKQLNKQRFKFAGNAQTQSTDLKYFSNERIDHVSRTTFGDYPKITFEDYSEFRQKNIEIIVRKLLRTNNHERFYLMLEIYQILNQQYQQHTLNNAMKGCSLLQFEKIFDKFQIKIQIQKNKENSKSDEFILNYKIYLLQLLLDSSVLLFKHMISQICKKYLFTVFLSFKDKLNIKEQQLLLKQLIVFSDCDYLDFDYLINQASRSHLVICSLDDVGDHHILSVIFYLMTHLIIQYRKKQIKMNIYYFIIKSLNELVRRFCNFLLVKDCYLSYCQEPNLDIEPQNNVNQLHEFIKFCLKMRQKAFYMIYRSEHPKIYKNIFSLINLTSKLTCFQSNIRLEILPEYQINQVKICCDYLFDIYKGKNMKTAIFCSQKRALSWRIFIPDAQSEAIEKEEMNIIFIYLLFAYSIQDNLKKTQKFLQFSMNIIKDMYQIQNINKVNAYELVLLQFVKFCFVKNYFELIMEEIQKFKISIKEQPKFLQGITTYLKKIRYQRKYHEFQQCQPQKNRQKLPNLTETNRSILQKSQNPQFLFNSKYEHFCIGKTKYALQKNVSLSQVFGKYSNIFSQELKEAWKQTYFLQLKLKFVDSEWERIQTQERENKIAPIKSTPFLEIIDFLFRIPNTVKSKLWKYFVSKYQQTLPKIQSNIKLMLQKIQSLPQIYNTFVQMFNIVEPDPNAFWSEVQKLFFLNLHMQLIQFLLVCFGFTPQCCSKLSVQFIIDEWNKIQKYSYQLYQANPHSIPLFFYITKLKFHELCLNYFCEQKQKYLKLYKESFCQLSQKVSTLCKIKYYKDELDCFFIENHFKLLFNFAYRIDNGQIEITESQVPYLKKLSKMFSKSQIHQSCQVNLFSETYMRNRVYLLFMPNPQNKKWITYLVFVGSEELFRKKKKEKRRFFDNGQKIGSGENSFITYFLFVVAQFVQKYKNSYYSQLFEYIVTLLDYNMDQILAQLQLKRQQQDSEWNQKMQALKILDDFSEQILVHLEVLGSKKYCGMILVSMLIQKKKYEILRKLQKVGEREIRTNEERDKFVERLLASTKKVFANVRKHIQDQEYEIRSKVESIFWMMLQQSSQVLWSSSSYLEKQANLSSQNHKNSQRVRRYLQVQAIRKYRHWTKKVIEIEQQQEHERLRQEGYQDYQLKERAQSCAKLVQYLLKQVKAQKGKRFDRLVRERIRQKGGRWIENTT